MAIIMILLFLLSNLLAIIDIPFLEPGGSGGKADAANIIVDDSGGQDHSTIQDAIDAANPGDTILVYNGTYNETVLVNKTVTIIGNGSANTIIDGEGKGSTVLNITANWANISGFNIRHTGLGGDVAGILIYNANNCRIENNNFSYNVMGVWLINTSNNKIANNTMIFNFWGVSLHSSANNTIDNNSFSSNFFGISLNTSNNNLIINNSMDSNYYIGVPLNPPDHDGNGFDDDKEGQNPFADSDNDGLMNTEEGGEPIAGPNGKDGGPGGKDGGPSVTDPFEADSDSDGLADGLELVLGLTPDEWDSDYDGVPDRYEINNFGIGIGTSTGNTIWNNTCTNYDNGILLVSSDNNTIDRYNTSSNGYGIWVYSGNKNIITNGTASYNSYGIWIYSGNNNTIANGNVSSNKKGIYIQLANHNFISNGRVSTNNYGIYIESGTNNTCWNLNISNNAMGIMLEASRYNEIYNNTLFSNNFRAAHPAYWDTDGNGIPDNQEDPYSNYSADSDGDGLTNGEEMELGEWDAQNPDMDGDGLTDGLEAAFGLDPYNSDSDRDGIDDVVEYNNRHISFEFSDNNNITDNICVNTTQGFFLMNSSLNSIIGNVLDSSSSYGIFIYSGYNNSAYDNQFIRNNNGSVQAKDNGTGNFWNKTAGRAVGKGNFWSDYLVRYPSASSDGNAWNNPYVINGSAESQDNSPLYLPFGVTDNSLGNGTTGDGFRFDIDFPDSIDVNSFKVNYSHGGQKGNLSLIKTDGSWTGNIVLDHDIANLTYTLYINSNNSYNFTISEKQVAISDNDVPQLLDDTSKDNSTTGDEFIFNITASDNIRVGAVFANWAHGGLSDNKSLVPSDGYWIGTIIIDDDMGNLTYTIFINDTSNNYHTETQQIIPVSDNDRPVINLDNSPDAGTTGDLFEFNVSVSDNIEIDTVFVEWAHGNLSGNESMNKSNGFWRTTVRLDNNNENLSYTVHANDTSNNHNSSSPQFAVISDNDVPKLINDSSSENGTTGDLFLFNVSASDNINVSSIHINWTHGVMKGNESLNRERGYWVGNITLDHSVDNLTYIIYIRDSSGNYNITSNRTVKITDNDKPTFTDNTELTGTTGEVLVINVSAIDNIFVYSVNIIWNHGLLGANLSLVETNGFWVGSIVIDHNTAGLTYRILVNDSSGNYNISTIRTVTVTDNDLPIVQAAKDVIVEENGTVNFDANATDNGGIANYTWKFVYNNSEVVLYGPKPQFKFEEPGNYTVDLNVTDASGNVNSTQITVTVLPKDVPVEIDLEPPVINHNPKTKVEINKNITITAVISDNVEVISTKLFYKNVGDSNYTDIMMKSTGSVDSYYAIIPAQNQFGNVSYYIYATDGLNEITLPKNIITTIFTITVTEEEAPKEKPKINILTPKKGDTIKGKITINVSTVNGYMGDKYVDLVMVKIEIREASSYKLVAEFSKTIMDNSSKKWFTFTWNSNTVDDGKYTINASGYTVGEGNETVYTKEISIEIGVTVENPPSLFNAVAGTVVAVAAAVGAATIASGAATGAISAGSASTSGSIFGKLLGYLDKFLDPLQKKAERALEEKTGKDATEFSIASPIITKGQIKSLVIAIFALMIPLTYVQVNGGFFLTWGGDNAFSWTEYYQALPSVFLTAAIFLIALGLAEVYAVRLRKQWTEFKVWGVGMFSLFLSSFFFLLPFGMTARLDQGYWKRIDKKGFGYVGLARYFITLMLTLPFFLMLLAGLKTAGESGMLICLMTFLYSMMPFGESPGRYIFKWRKSVWIIGGIFAAVLFYGWRLDLIPRMFYFIFGIIGLAGAGYVYIHLMRDSRKLRPERERALRKIASKSLHDDDEEEEEEEKEEEKPVVTEETIEGDEELASGSDEEDGKKKDDGPLESDDEEKEKGKDEDDADVWEKSELPEPADDEGENESGEPPAPPEDVDVEKRPEKVEEPYLQKPPENDAEQKEPQDPEENWESDESPAPEGDTELEELPELVKSADPDEFASLDDDVEQEVLEPAKTVEAAKAVEADEFASLDDAELVELPAPSENVEPDDMELDMPPVPPD